MDVSRSLLAARHSGIRHISQLAAGQADAIRLEVGQPDFRTPAHIVAAAKRALDEGWHGYTPTAGLPELRERLTSKLQRVNGIRVGPEQVVCGTGGAGVIGAAVLSLCNPGDEVMLPDPGWPNYHLLLATGNLRAVRYPCLQKDGFLPDPDRLSSLVTRRTRAIVVNSPNNPTGAVYPPELLRGLGELAERHGLWLVSDECYDQIMLDGGPPAPGLRAHSDPDRVVTCFTFSKTYAMTGWRLGYAVAPPEVADMMVKVTEGTTSSQSTVAQKAGEAALDGPQDCVIDMVAGYRRRRDLTVELLEEAGLLTVVPEGAFYILADVSASGLASLDFAERLLRERGVAVAPGSAFGEVVERAVRISLASSDADLREGLGRLCDQVGALGGVDAGHVPLQRARD